jgi:threonyl-tRNA synthetase
VTNTGNTETMRHSLAHIMAAAVTKIWPEAKLGVGPIIENGFYYDFDLGSKVITVSDFAKIESLMKSIIKAKIPFVRKDVSVEEAMKWAKDFNQPYKMELLIDLADKGTTSVKEPGADSDTVLQAGNISLYTCGDFTDLCRGPHVNDTSEVGVFKITKVAGAYWRGKETNPQMQRLYAVAFNSREELESYLQKLEEAKKRDHRKLGKELDLYHIDEEVGSGLVMWHPKGALLWRLIEQYWYDEHLKNGYDLVRSPHIGSRTLWEKSGHWGFYSGSMFPPLEAGQSLEDTKSSKKVEKSEQYLLKPMNCPFHVQIYKNSQHSYRDLPIRWAEMGTVYRYEKTGELSGLTRVRGFTQDDAHIICREDQVKDELKRVIDFILDIYRAFGFDKKSVKVYLSLRDHNNKEKYAGDDTGWEFTERVLREVSDEKELNYVEERGEAAFYGPKLDFKVNDVIDREWQCSTLQFDFNLPNRFEMVYTDASGKEEKPYMLHRALFGSMERFIGLMIEHYGGAFPVWLAPEQIRLVTVNQNDNIVSFADGVAEQAKELGLRITVDGTNESVGKKIREAEGSKVPYVIVIGEKEIETNETIPRIRKDLVVQEASAIKIENLLKTIANESKSRTLRTTM